MQKCHLPIAFSINGILGRQGNGRGYDAFFNLPNLELLNFVIWREKVVRNLKFRHKSTSGYLLVKCPKNMQKCHLPIAFSINGILGRQGNGRGYDD